MITKVNKPNPFFVFDIDVFVQKNFFGKKSIRIPGVFVARYLAEKFNANIAVISLDKESRYYLSEFAETYGWGIQRFITDSVDEELYFMDRSGLLSGGVIKEKWDFEPISRNHFYTYDRVSDIEKILLTFQGTIL